MLEKPVRHPHGGINRQLVSGTVKTRVKFGSVCIFMILILWGWGMLTRRREKKIALDNSWRSSVCLFVYLFIIYFTSHKFLLGYREKKTELRIICISVCTA